MKNENYKMETTRVYKIDGSLVVGKCVEEAIAVYYMKYPGVTIESVDLVKDCSGFGSAIMRVPVLELNSTVQEVKLPNKKDFEFIENAVTDVDGNAKTRERTKTLEDYERVRMHRYEGLPKYICFGNAKDIEGKTCECYPAREGYGGWGIVVSSLGDGLDGFVEYLKNKLSGMPDKNGVWDVWLVSGGDKTSVGVGTYMVKDVVLVKNLSQQIKTKGVETLFLNIR